jgi:hypothetical protein
MIMILLDRIINIGMTWDQIAPLLEEGTKKSLEVIDEDSYRGTWEFPLRRITLEVTLRRFGDTPYKLIDWKIFDK